jgi:RNA polymerase sigma factor (TIGR02999 family)
MILGISCTIFVMLLLTPESSPDPGSSLIQRAEGGDALARSELFASLYADLHRIARREAARFGSMPSLGTTTLLHEAYLDLSGRAGLVFNDEAHFLGYAARAMRGLVIDHVRQRHAAKRGGGLHITSLDTELAEQCSEPDALQDLSDALDEMAQQEPDLAHVVDLKFFCGFTLVEISAMKNISERTAQRQWEKARLLLRSALKGA